VFNIEIPRLSGSSDILPITVSERLLKNDSLVGQKVLIDGQFRSYNGTENAKSKLILTVFAKDVTFLDEAGEEEASKLPSNDVILNGYICKKPIYRQTPFGREIADILLAVNRSYNKSDYIPCIAWGRNARFCQDLEVGKQVRIVGRVQSRTYEKKFEDGTVETKVAYEVSVSGLEIIETSNNSSENEDENKEVV
jgi:single-stranded DNA-binding protein